MRDAPAPAVTVRRSARRRRTVTAYREAGHVFVLLPARMSAADERRWVGVMVERLTAMERRRIVGDTDLAQRAGRLSERYLDGAARPTSVRFVANQRTRWGSCTPADGSIRLSDRLRWMPAFVVDYVLVHELAHLLVAGHSARFWALVRRYPDADRARGYLEGFDAARNGPAAPAGLGPSPCLAAAAPALGRPTAPATPADAGRAACPPR